GSTLITSAPWSDRIMVQYGPPSTRVRSTTLMPASAPAVFASPLPIAAGLNASSICLLAPLIWRGRIARSPIHATRYTRNGVAAMRPRLFGLECPLLVMDDSATDSAP